MPKNKRTSKKPAVRTKRSRAANMLIVAVIALVITFVGSLGYNAWQDRSSKAEAESAEFAPEAGATTEAEERNNLKTGWKTIQPEFSQDIRLRICKNATGPRQGIKVWAKRISSKGDRAAAFMQGSGSDIPFNSRTAWFDAQELSAGTIKGVGGYTNSDTNPRVYAQRRGVSPSDTHTQVVLFKALPICP